jgi:hypothetical protein
MFYLRIDRAEALQLFIEALMFMRYDERKSEASEKMGAVVGAAAMFSYRAGGLRIDRALVFKKEKQLRRCFRTVLL